MDRAATHRSCVLSFARHVVASPHTDDLGPPEYFAPFAGEAKIPTGSFRSMKTAFCIEACVLGPLLGQNHAILSETSQGHSDASQSALDAVRVFYTYITEYQHWAFLRDAQRRLSGHSSAND